jgi:cardiolipin synthase A/B
VAIEDASVARHLEDVYLRDLANSTEIVLSSHRRIRPVVPRGPLAPRGSGRPPVGAVRFANAVGAAAASGTRALGAVEGGIELALAGGLLALAVVGVLWPAVLAYPLSALGVWLSLALLLRARRNAQQRKADRAGPSAVQGPPKSA